MPIDKNYEVVASSHKKFFDYQDPLCHKVDQSCSKIYKKLDGHLAILYFYANEWQLATAS